MFRLPLLLSLLLALTACTAPAATAPVSSQAITPIPAARETTPSTAPVVIDSSCKVDADCTVKNVGNCCGYYPSCVNINSATDPAGVQASCQAKGMMSVCGFPEIQGCSCVQGKCAAAGSSNPLRQPMTDTATPVR